MVNKNSIIATNDARLTPSKLRY